MKSLVLLPVNLVLLPAFVVALWLLRSLRRSDVTAPSTSRPSVPSKRG